MSTDYDLKDFLARQAKRQATDARVAAWHIQAHVEGGVKLPYDPFDNWINVNVWSTEEGKYEIDAEASLDALAHIVQFASKQPGVTIEKRYGSSDFDLEITLPDDVTIRYYANREAVCTKKVVGYKDIPEKVTPARREEIVEWDCEPVSLLARNLAESEEA